MKKFLSHMVQKKHGWKELICAWCKLKERSEKEGKNLSVYFKINCGLEKNVKFEGKWSLIFVERWRGFC